MAENYVKRTSIDIPYEIHNLARDNMIELKGALIFGVRFLLAEKGISDYPNCNIITEYKTNINKTEKIIKRLELETQENFKLKDKLKDLGYDFSIEAIKAIEESPKTKEEAKEFIKGLGEPEK